LICFYNGIDEDSVFDKVEYRDSRANTKITYEEEMKGIFNPDFSIFYKTLKTS
jgi:hypothetical protein